MYLQRIEICSKLPEDLRLGLSLSRKFQAGGHPTHNHTSATLVSFPEYQNHSSAEKNSILLLGLKGQVAVITFNIKTPLRASSNRAKEGKQLNKKKHGGESPPNQIDEGSVSKP
jgi:hypothetical protein